jgi:hypothetical protein
MRVVIRYPVLVDAQIQTDKSPKKLFAFERGEFDIAEVDPSLCQTAFEVPHQISVLQYGGKLYERLYSQEQVKAGAFENFNSRSVKDYISCKKTLSGPLDVHIRRQVRPALLSEGSLLAKRFAPKNAYQFFNHRDEEPNYKMLNEFKLKELDEEELSKQRALMRAGIDDLISVRGQIWRQCYAPLVIMMVGNKPSLQSPNAINSVVRTYPAFMGINDMIHEMHVSHSHHTFWTDIPSIPEFSRNLETKLADLIGGEFNWAADRVFHTELDGMESIDPSVKLAAYGHKLSQLFSFKLTKENSGADKSWAFHSMVENLADAADIDLNAFVSLAKSLHQLPQRGVDDAFVALIADIASRPQGLVGGRCSRQEIGMVEVMCETILDEVENWDNRPIVAPASLPSLPSP